MPKKLKWLRGSIIRLLVSFIIITAISFIPSMYKVSLNRYEINFDIDTSSYIQSMQDYYGTVMKGSLGEYVLETHSFGLWGDEQVKTRPLSKDIFKYFTNTITIFLPGLILGILFGIGAAFLTILMRQRWRIMTNFLSFLIVSLPDFFVVLVLQALVILLYKKTGFKPFAVATGGSSKAVLLPIITLAIFPFIFIYRSTINSFEEVFTNRFIHTAYAKGLNKLKVVWSHVVKNGLIVTLNNLPNTIMPAVSNLFIIEYLFNTHGLTSFVFSHQDSSNVLITSVFLIWFMVEAVLLINDMIIKFISKYRGEIHA